MSNDILEKNEVTIEEENKLDKYILITTLNNKTCYQCKLCNYIFDSKGTLKKHLNKKNKCYITDTNQCKYCSKQFVDKNKLKRHLDKQKKCYNTSNTKIEIENLESNEEKLKKQILKNEEEIKELKRIIEGNKEDNKNYTAEIYDTFFQSYVNKFGNLDLMFFTSNFLRNNRYDTRVNEYNNFIINLFDKCRLEILQKILEDIENYKKKEKFELLLKNYEKELELRIKNDEYKKVKYTLLEDQLKEIKNFIKRNYEKET